MLYYTMMYNELLGWEILVYIYIYNELLDSEILVLYTCQTEKRKKF